MKWLLGDLPYARGVFSIHLRLYPVTDRPPLFATFAEEELGRNSPDLPHRNLIVWLRCRQFFLLSEALAEAAAVTWNLELSALVRALLQASKPSRPSLAGLPSTLRPTINVLHHSRELGQEYLIVAHVQSSLWLRSLIHGNNRLWFAHGDLGFLNLCSTFSLSQIELSQDDKLPTTVILSLTKTISQLFVNLAKLCSIAWHCGDPVIILQLIGRLLHHITNVRDNTLLLLRKILSRLFELIPTEQ